MLTEYIFELIMEPSTLFNYEPNVFYYETKNLKPSGRCTTCLFYFFLYTKKNTLIKKNV